MIQTLMRSRAITLHVFDFIGRFNGERTRQRPIGDDVSVPSQWMKKLCRPFHIFQCSDIEGFVTVTACRYRVGRAMKKPSTGSPSVGEEMTRKTFSENRYLFSCSTFELSVYSLY
ncbi:hypothetical protein EVAR_52882_1 [Eumeta japonica]|uniref:Uncharacterized protein n=1 Tax=Eumeta variegata TaxID=151549 RepID=A0A4C1YM14_EUMVA|nr:hypothetical protein EVAR_52882_1 [Eumeta japonica]